MAGPEATNTEAAYAQNAADFRLQFDIDDPLKSYWVFHITLARALPGIAREQALLPAADLGARAIRVNTYGSPEKEAILNEFVFLSFLPTWWMREKAKGRNGREEELVLLIILGDELWSQRNACLVPRNTAERDLSTEDILAASNESPGGVDRLLACRENKKHSELLIRGPVPVDKILYVVFGDQTSQDYWWPKFLKNLPEPPPQHRLRPRLSTKDRSSDVRNYRLPDNHDDPERLDESGQPR